MRSIGSRMQRRGGVQAYGELTEQSFAIPIN
jgi:hypothetical protein